MDKKRRKSEDELIEGMSRDIAKGMGAKLMASLEKSLGTKVDATILTAYIDGHINAMGVAKVGAENKESAESTMLVLAYILVDLLREKHKLQDGKH